MAMSPGPEQIVRSEMEGGLSGPANSLTDESIDCGCGRYPLPRLAKFATRRIFLTLLCSIGALQAAAQAYFHVTSSDVARKFHFDPNLMEWIVCIPEITPAIFGLIIAYWGDKFHRASWLGALALIQCVSFFTLIIPHCVNDVAEPKNLTHMPLLVEGGADFCMRTSPRVIGPEEPPHYSALFILIGAQIVTGMANIAYYALGISYLDDNTKREQAPTFIGVVLATKFLGRVFGYIMGWVFLRIDVDNFQSIETSPSQIGAWWLGWPIYTILLTVPSIFMAIFPRKLVSEMVEQAAATILDQSGTTLRGSQRSALKKVVNPQFFPSIVRLLKNKIIIFNILAAIFYVMALTNFIHNENIFLESKFYAPRPIGILAGFGDPLVSRAIATLIKPILIGFTIIITGLIINRAKPKARTIVIYNFVILLASGLIILCLAFLNCEKAPIVGTYKERIYLLQNCNKDCQCSRNADFRPVCDKNGSFVFFSPCHAGCTIMYYENNQKVYNNCSCVEKNVGPGNTEAIDGLCGSSNCQFGWILYEILTMLIYAAIASTVIGDVLLSLRSINPQDKALLIGYSLSLLGFFTYVVGKLSYDQYVKSACKLWGLNDNICHLHHSTSLGNYLCFVTSGFIVIGALFKIGAWFFSKNLEIYDSAVIESEQSTEMKNISKTQVEPLLQPTSTFSEENLQNNETKDDIVENDSEPVVILESTSNNISATNAIIEENTSSSRLKYGPLGPGDKRVTKNRSNGSIINTGTDDDLDSSDSSHIPGKSSLSQVSYKPLEIDSDVESDLSGTAPRSRKRISSTDIDEPGTMLREYSFRSKHRFPNTENYEDPQKLGNSNNISPKLLTSNSVQTNGLENMNEQANDTLLATSKGDFNEIGIPIIESYEAAMINSSNSLRSPTLMLSMQYLDKKADNNLIKDDNFNYNSSGKYDNEEIEENRNFRLEKLMQPADYPAVAPRPPSREQGSSGFGSLQDIRDKIKLQGDISDSRDSSSTKSSVCEPQKKGSPLCTDL